jgi:hypothetical protein
MVSHRIKIKYKITDTQLHVLKTLEIGAMSQQPCNDIQIR